MKLHTLYARFYKSFNFDHLRKAHHGAEQQPWEMYEGMWFPYIQVQIDSRVTTIVGANESGKSHLLSAIEKAISGEEFMQRDLCRYSPFFNVERGQLCWPHLGLSWTDLDDEEQEKLRASLKEPIPQNTNRFAMFRQGPEILSVFVPSDGGTWLKQDFAGPAARDFGKDFLPKTFRIKADIALPNFVPVKWLADPNVGYESMISRGGRLNLMEAGARLNEMWSNTAGNLTAATPQIMSSFGGFFQKNAQLQLTEAQRESLHLARDLLIEVAEIDPKRLGDLSDAIAHDEDGFAHALMARINEQLAKKLNFPKWWVQDRDFSLQISSGDVDLVFTVKDKTGTEYTFKERSSGLKYFLSYLVQSQVHKRLEHRSEILLMDEPDTYLSAEAQQDLMKILADFSEPTGEQRPIQVVYVTHSPFLLDKNHADRIRVLEKGRARDGTRVIDNAAKNHYEPLRSALGAFIGETAFVGACNLLVEGISDQVLLAGCARLIRRKPGFGDSETLDLNRIVLVPCGSATQVTYMLYLVRGRDLEKPPVVVLLDSDNEGNQEAQMLRGEDKKIRRLIRKELVLQINDEPTEGEYPVRTMEDLLPLDLALAAANACLSEIVQFREGEAPVLELDPLKAALAEGSSVFKALNQLLLSQGGHIDKLAFARSVVTVCDEAGSDSPFAPAIAAFLGRMRALYRRINTARRRAEWEMSQERVGAAVGRLETLFLRDNPAAAKKELALAFFEQLNEVLDDSNESDDVRAQRARIRKEFKLDESSNELIADYERFKNECGKLKDAFKISHLKLDHG
jgi:predicted ATPase